MIKEEVTKGLGFSLDYLFKDEAEEHNLRSTMNNIDIEDLLFKRH